MTPLLETKVQYRYFCPACGELETDQKGQIIHPEMDRAIYNLLKNGFRAENI